MLNISIYELLALVFTCGGFFYMIARDIFKR